MKIQIVFFLLSFLTADCLAQKAKIEQDLTSVHHYRNNISLFNYDGSTSSIYVSGNGAVLFIADGTQSSIDFGKRTSRLVAKDGTTSTVFHSGMSSTIYKQDGTQIFISHMQSISSCSTEIGKHIIKHTFGSTVEICNKNHIDVLLHMNWLVEKQALSLAQEEKVEEPQK